MRMASWQWGGREHVGTISPDGREATPLALADASRGVLPLIQLLARGAASPSPSGARLPVEVLSLRVQMRDQQCDLHEYFRYGGAVRP